MSGVCPERGEKVSLEDVAIWHERMGKSTDEIANEYDLTLAEVYAALAYYFVHRDEIDQSIEDGESFVTTVKQSRPSKLRAKLS
ncbi:MAG: DUF433 domain-containing protein [Phycisphaerae bacterium]|nr:DUF433 domain-containing protein [Phycisphaerae bacterium]